MLWIHYFAFFLGQDAIRTVAGKYAAGHLITHENWAFVARFCFLSEEGKFQYEIEYEQEHYGTVNLLLYYDSEVQWPTVYKTNKTCSEKESTLNILQNQIVNLTSTQHESGCVLQKSRSTGKGGITIPATLLCKQIRRFRSSRERWWFIAVSNCKSTKGLNIRYKFWMTNGPPDDYWHEHLSADEFYILPILMSFTLIYMLMILAIVMCSVELKARQFLHATYKLFIVSVSLQELGIMSQAIAFIRYAVDGVGYPRMKNFGRVAESASEICFLLLLLLLAKGYTVTRGRLRLASSIKMTIFMCLYVVCYTCLFIYEREFFDPGEVLYIYESPAGYGLITLRIVAWWMFIYSTVFTLKHYPEKASFYYPFNVIGTLWFVAGPGVVLAANNLIDKWVRESIVCGAFHGIAFGGHILFLILTLPSKANKNFPYHVRTNQIGMMEITGVSGNNSIYQFGHHPYAPGGPVGIREVPLELFTVSRNLDIRAKTIDYESQPYPHELPPGYTQTILLPITIRSNSNETTPESSGYNTPRPQEIEDDVIRTRSAMITNSERMVDDERKAYSADCKRENSDPPPSAPPEDFENTRASYGMHPNSTSNSRPDTASTVSINTAMKNREIEMSVEKLTDMFIAQSHKKIRGPSIDIQFLNATLKISTTGENYNNNSN